MALIGISFQSQTPSILSLPERRRLAIEYITQTANAKTEFVPLCRSFRLVKYGQWFVDQIDFTYVCVYRLVRAATSCRWVCRYSLNRHPCTSVGQTIIDIGSQVPHVCFTPKFTENYMRNWDIVTRIDPHIETIRWRFDEYELINNCNLIFKPGRGCNIANLLLNIQSERL